MHAELTLFASIGWPSIQPRSSARTAPLETLSKFLSKSGLAFAALWMDVGIHGFVIFFLSTTLEWEACKCLTNFFEARIRVFVKDSKVLPIHSLTLAPVHFRMMGMWKIWNERRQNWRKAKGHAHKEETTSSAMEWACTNVGRTLYSSLCGGQPWDLVGQNALMSECTKATRVMGWTFGTRDQLNSSLTLHLNVDINIVQSLRRQNCSIRVSLHKVGLSRTFFFKIKPSLKLPLQNIPQESNRSIPRLMEVRVVRRTEWCYVWHGIWNLAHMCHSLLIWQICARWNSPWMA